MLGHYFNLIKDVIKNPYLIISKTRATPLFHWMPDDLYLKCCYKAKYGRSLDLSNPQTFNEKLQWLKLYDRNPLYTRLVDKYEVRSYIKEKIGEKYLIPLVGGPWNNCDEININQLPEKFVLKCTHDSGSIIICKDKSKFDFDEAKKKLQRSLKKNFYYMGREWPYKNVSPKIIAEKFMEDKGEIGLKDYKMMCFNSEVKASFVCSNRYKEGGLYVTFFDRDWNRMPFERHYPASPEYIKKPDRYDEMVELAEKLSENMTFVRIDFYEINGQVFFGEFTFFPGNGLEEFSPDQWDYKLGEWIKLSDKRVG